MPNTSYWGELGGEKKEKAYNTKHQSCNSSVGNPSRNQYIDQNLLFFLFPHQKQSSLRLKYKQQVSCMIKKQVYAYFLGLSFSLTVLHCVCVCICVCLYMYLPQHMCRGQKTPCKIQFSPSTVWVLDIDRTQVFKPRGRCLISSAPSSASFSFSSSSSFFFSH